jgi:hypothetical protein
MAETPKPTDITKKPTDHTWHDQQAKLLKNWAEVASSYRWMHYQAYMTYKRKNLHFMIPLIIMSTVTGTANFAQNTFPEFIRPNVPQIIGAINLISAIMTTIYQFLKISEFMESHRISAVNYGKLARSITVELNLPVKDRETGGAECVKTVRTEIDRLIEQSPTIPKHVLVYYESKFSNKGLAEPEIIVINKVDIYRDVENKVATNVAQASMKLKELKRNRFQNMVDSIKANVVSLSPKKQSMPQPPSTRENLMSELELITSSRLVSSLKRPKNITFTDPVQIQEVVETHPAVIEFTQSIPDTETEHMAEVIQTADQVPVVINENGENNV